MTLGRRLKGHQGPFSVIVKTDGLFAALAVSLLTRAGPSPDFLRITFVAWLGMGGMSGDILYQISLETYTRNSTALIRCTCSTGLGAPIRRHGGRHTLNAIVDNYRCQCRYSRYLHSVDIEVVGSFHDNAECSVTGSW